MDGWMVGWLDGCVNGWLVGWMTICVDGWLGAAHEHKMERCTVKSSRAFVLPRPQANRARLTQKMERRTIETFKKHADIGLEGFCPTTRMHQRSHQVLVAVADAKDAFCSNRGERIVTEVCDTPSLTQDGPRAFSETSCPRRRLPASG